VTTSRICSASSTACGPSVVTRYPAADKQRPQYHVVDRWGLVLFSAAAHLGDG
jgi:hypothetical protein